MNLSLCYVTIAVSNLNKAKHFYEKVCGFKPTIYYEPTKWQAYDMGDNAVGFAIIEDTNLFNPPQSNMVDFFVNNVEELYNRLRLEIKIISKLNHTDWGSYKFVIEDPDGNQLGFVKRD